MFAAPPDRIASVHARLNAEQHHPAGQSSWLELQRPGQKPSSFLEGPVFDANGTLWFVDIPWGRIYKLPAGGHMEQVLQYDGLPNGLAQAPDGQFWIADAKLGIVRLDLAAGRIVPVLNAFEGMPFRGVNDLVFAGNGDLYFTDQGQSGLHDPYGRLFRLSKEGRLDCILRHIPSPNGLVLDAQERTLYLAVTRDNAVWRVPLQADGSVTKVGVFIRLSGGVGPDGLAIDAEDNLYVCHLGLGSVWKFNRLGEPVLRIRSPEGLLTTNAALGGDMGDELFITESSSGTILRVSTVTP